MFSSLCVVVIMLVTIRYLTDCQSTTEDADQPFTEWPAHCDGSNQVENLQQLLIKQDQKLDQQTHLISQIIQTIQTFSVQVNARFEKVEENQNASQFGNSKIFQELMTRWNRLERNQQLILNISQTTRTNDQMVSLIKNVSHSTEELRTEVIRTSQTCDKFVSTALGLGDLIFQQHYNGTAFFNRSWAEFKVGFGDVTGEYWIGNERLHQLTREGRYKLYANVQARYDNQWYWAEYQTFIVGEESTQYRLEIGGYRGTAGDSLASVNGMKFSTRDRDNDENAAGHCAQHYGGFWYNNCFYASVNSPLFGNYGFAWYHLPVGTVESWTDKKLIASRLTLLLK